MLVDNHWTWRENQALARGLKKSKLSSEPWVEDINYRYPRQMDPGNGARADQLAMGRGNISISCSRGRPESARRGSGKRWRRRLSRWLQRVVSVAAKLFRDLAQARADGSLGRLLESIARTDVLLWTTSPWLR